MKVWVNPPPHHQPSFLKIVHNFEPRFKLFCFDHTLTGKRSKFAGVFANYLGS